MLIKKTLALTAYLLRHLLRLLAAFGDFAAGAKCRDLGHDLAIYPPNGIVDRCMLDRSDSFLNRLGVASRCFIIALAVVSLANAASAEPQRFTKIGDRLLFDGTVLLPEAVSDDIGAADEDELDRYLGENPDIRTVVLNSLGGSMSSGRAMGEIITKFGIDTEVAGRCLSACVLIFIGGKHRTLDKGSVLGFHRSYLEVPSIDEREDPESLVADLYDLGEVAALEDLHVMLDRGVDIHFMLKALKHERNDMWYPTRAELFAAGVSTAP